MSGPVLVTGAGGKTGRAVIAALQARDAPVRAFVRDADRHADLARGCGIELATGDQRDAADLLAAVRGCRAVYAIAPNVSPDEVVMGRVVIEACRRVGGVRLVYHSVMDPFEPSMPHHIDKGEVEGLIVADGCPATILRPNAYLQNLDGYLDDIRGGRYRVPYATDRDLAMVDLREVAEVAARALLDDLPNDLPDDADGAVRILELCGPRPVSPSDVAAAAGDILGHPVVAEREDPDDWAARNTHLPGDVRQRLHAMFRYYDGHGFPGEPASLRGLLGRPPTDLRTYLAERLQDGQ